MDAKLIAIYARVSTARQEEERTVENQLSVLREYARTNGHTIVKEYVDDGWSGDILARPGLDDLRQDAKRKIWGAVLIYDPDRLARRYSYQELVMDELREANVEVSFITVAAPKSPEDKILHGVRGLFAEYERAKISERFRLGKLRRVREGHVLVTEAGYGYRYIPKNEMRHGYYEIDEDEAKVVRMIFHWIADDGYTLKHVVRRLHALDIKPRKSKRGVWNTSTLCTLVRHKCYIGEMHWGKHYAVVAENPRVKDKYRKNKKTSSRIRPESEWMKIPVPAIIDRELFDRVQVQLEKNLSLHQRNKKNDYLLAGIIRCVCGRSRTGEGPKRGKYLYYRCSDRVLSAPLPPRCHERGVNARVSDCLVWQKISSMMTSPKLLETQVQRWIEARKTPTRVITEEREEVKREIARIKSAEDRYNNAYGAGLFTIEQLRLYLIPIRTEIASLETRLKTFDETVHDVSSIAIPTQSELREFARRCEESLANLNFDEKRAIVLKTVEKVVTDQKELQVYGHIPVTSSVNVFTSDRYGKDIDQQNHVEFKTSDRHGQEAPRHMNSCAIPFEFTISLPAPLRGGVDYGFLPGSNISKSARETGA